MVGILEKKYFTILAKTKGKKSENRYVHLFEFLDTFIPKFTKYSSNINRDFPVLQNKNILAKVAYHFTNEKELLSIFLIIESDNNKVSDGSLHFIVDYYEDIENELHSNLTRVLSTALDPIVSGPGF